jgi:TATA-box binding protein (TBP) (component of TFIID and TFIIIB)
MEILNVKASFKIGEDHRLDENNEDYLFYSAGFVNILKCDEFTFSVMGFDRRYINITGCKSLKNIDKAVELFKEKSKVTSTLDVKINSISFKFSVTIESFKLSHLKSSQSNVFNVKTFPRFSGICFKHKKLRIAGNFFLQSKKIVCMGAKSLIEISEYIKDLQEIGFTLIN